MGDKRSGQWFGDAFIKTVLAGPNVADVIQLLPTVTSVQSPRDVVFERSIVNFQTRRIGVSTVEALGFIVWKGLVLSGTTTPVEALDPNSTSTFSWSHGSIMHYGTLHVPALIPVGDAATRQISEEVTSHEIDFSVKRSVQRANEGIFLMVSADISSQVRVNTTFRTYYTYG